MKKILPEELVQHGLHFGHKKTRLNPHSKKFLYKIDQGIAIIDLFKTADSLEAARQYLYELGQKGEVLLVIATKKQAKKIVAEACERASIYYLTNKWIGGFLTNFDEILKNVAKMNEWATEKEAGEWDKFPKHEVVEKEKKLRRVHMIYRGVKTLEKLPAALFIIDIKKEDGAVSEGRQKKIPIVAVVDTNSDPNLVDYPIPANDDAVSSIQFLTNSLIEAYVAGREKQKKDD